MHPPRHPALDPAPAAWPVPAVAAAARVPESLGPRVSRVSLVFLDVAAGQWPRRGRNRRNATWVWLLWSEVSRRARDRHDVTWVRFPGAACPGHAGRPAGPRAPHRPHPPPRSRPRPGPGPRRGRGNRSDV